MFRLKSSEDKNKPFFLRTGTADASRPEKATEKILPRRQSASAWAAVMRV